MNKAEGSLLRDKIPCLCSGRDGSLILSFNELGDTYLLPLLRIYVELVLIFAGLRAHAIVCKPLKCSHLNLGTFGPL
jgi:hypothetical protein